MYKQKVLFKFYLILTHILITIDNENVMTLLRQSGMSCMNIKENI